MNKISNKLICIFAAVIIGVVLVVFFSMKHGNSNTAVSQKESNDIPSTDTITTVISSEYSSKNDNSYHSTEELSDPSCTEDSSLQQTDSSHEEYSSTSPGEPSSDSSDITNVDTFGDYLEIYAEMVNDGTYSITVQRHYKVGGLSVPVVTKTVHGKGFISILEYETHDIYTEILINENGAYYINDTEKICHLYPTDYENIHSVSFEGIHYITNGTCTIGGVKYNYEKYVTSNGSTVDFLFNGDYLCKLKLYSGNEYEYIGLEISDETENARNDIPCDYKVIDHR